MTMLKVGMPDFDYMHMEVWLDGEPQMLAFAADDDAGWVDVYDGVDDDGNLIVVRLTGKVEFKPIPYNQIGC